MKYLLLLFTLLNINAISQNCVVKCSPDCIDYTATCAGGTGTCTYLWDTNETTQTIQDCVTGLQTHTVTVTDVNGCTAVQTIEGSIDPLFIMSITTVPGVCADSDGTMTANVVTGYTWTYLWSSGETTASITIPPANCGATYGVTITNENGCTAQAQDFIDCGLSPSCEISTVDETCGGGNGGIQASNPFGQGTPPFTYTLGTTSNSTGTFINLGAGTYVVTITDANNCTNTCSGTINNIGTNLSPTCGTIVDASCFGGNDGEVTVDGNGIAPYTYIWSNGQTTNPATGLIAGAYTVTVTDNGGCTGEVTCSVGEPTQLLANCVPTDVQCNGGSDGQLDITASGGTSPYDFDLNGTTNTTGIFTGLTAGTYIVTVTDANGCTVDVTCTINEPIALATSCTANDATCFGNSDGSATAVPTGGTPSYGFTWSNGGNTNPQTNLAAGTYSYTVTDANGCTITGDCVVNEPAELTVTISCQ